MTSPFQSNSALLRWRKQPSLMTCIVPKVISKSPCLVLCAKQSSRDEWETAPITPLSEKCDLVARDLDMTVGKGNRGQLREHLSLPPHNLGRVIHTQRCGVRQRGIPPHIIHLLKYHYNKSFLEKPLGFKRYAVLCIFGEHLERNSWKNVLLVQQNKVLFAMQCVSKH